MSSDTGTAQERNIAIRNTRSPGGSKTRIWMMGRSDSAAPACCPSIRRTTRVKHHNANPVNVNRPTVVRTVLTLAGAVSG